MLYVLFALTSFGAIFDNRWFAVPLEIIRCLVYFAFDYYLIAFVPWPVERNIMKNILFYGLWAVRIFHSLSILFWIAYSFLVCAANILLKKKNGHFNANVIASVSSTEKIKSDENGKEIMGDSDIETTTISSTDPHTKNVDSNSSVFKILFNLKATTVMIMLTLGFFSASTISFLYFSKFDACSQFLDALVNEIQV